MCGWYMCVYIICTVSIWRNNEDVISTKNKPYSRQFEKRRPLMRGARCSPTVQLNFSNVVMWSLLRSTFNRLWDSFPKQWLCFAEHPQPWPVHRMKTCVIHFQTAQMGTVRLRYLYESHIAYTVYRMHVELLAVTKSSLWLLWEANKVKKKNPLIYFPFFFC